MYIQRYAQSKLTRFTKNYKIIQVLGARQVGKTTLLRQQHPEARYFVFDPAQDLYNAKQDPDMFLQTFTPPLILDEIQYTPELLASLKRHVDTIEKKGSYLLTGSQNFAALQSISESMAGRVGILELGPITPFERCGIALEKTWITSYLNAPDTFHKTPFGLLKEHMMSSIWKGGYPGTLNFEIEDFKDFYKSYVQTYTERDIRMLSNIKDVHTFSSFLAAQAALTAQESNHTQIANTVGITAKTAHEWANLQSYGYQTFTVPPYSGNLLKRVSKSPKSYLTDTGLACYLLRITSPDALLGHSAFGALFETFCVSTIRSIVAFDNVQLHHWRTNAGAEVDLIIEKDGKFFPIEFKAKTNPTRKDARGILQFKKDYTHLNIQKGLVIHGGTEIIPLGEHAIGIPWNFFCLE
jgi:predicted AAA+ superfamily ATPase